MRAVRLNALAALMLGFLALGGASAQAFETKPYDAESFKAAQSAGKQFLSTCLRRGARPARRSNRCLRS